MLKILQCTNITSWISEWDIFSPFSSLVILFSAVLPSNFWCHKFYVRSCLLIIYWKQTWISDTEYDPSGNFSFYVEPEILYLLFLYSCFMFFHVYFMLIFDKRTYLSLPFKFIWSKKLSNRLWVSDVLRSSKFLYIVCVLIYNFIEFIILFYTFIVISLAWCREYIIWRILFSKFSDVLFAFTCGNLWRNLLEINILIPFLCVGFNGSYPLLRALRTNDRPS